MTLTIQMEKKNPAFLDALKKFVAQWQGVKIETQETQDKEDCTAELAQKGEKLQKYLTQTEKLRNLYSKDLRRGIRYTMEDF